MESFKEEHSDGKVFSMDIQKLKTYASKHKMKVALGTTMAAALIAGASVGTYAYFTSQATAKTNLTLNKGTVTLGEVPNSNWKYLGNSTDISNDNLSDKYEDISLNGISVILEFIFSAALLLKTKPSNNELLASLLLP